jgi:hypothetical protein
MPPELLSNKITKRSYSRYGGRGPIFFGATSTANRCANFRRLVLLLLSRLAVISPIDQYWLKINRQMLT